MAKWLESVIAVGRPTFDDAEKDASTMERWLDNLAEWSDAAGVDYPGSFIKLPRWPDLRVVVTTHPQASMSPNGVHVRPMKMTSRPVRQAGRYWELDPATWAYRGMLRHLRRHVARGAGSFVLDCLSDPDPIRIASEMREKRGAMVAFAEMLWSAQLEHHVQVRRWPYREVQQSCGGDLVGRVKLPFVSLPADGNVRQDSDLQRWLEYQACRCMLLSYWRESQRRAVEAIRTGVADWTPIRGADACRWSTVQCERSVSFVSLESHGEWDWTLPRRDKASRRDDDCLAAALRMRRLEEECSGQCLTWSERDGWQVRPSSLPTCGRVDRHRLLGVGTDRPKFWLFESGDHFVSRLCDVKLQTLGDSPRHAIANLRRALRQHRSAYPQDVGATPAVLKPLRDQARCEYEQKLVFTLRDHGFWGGAPKFQSIAWGFLQARIVRPR